MRHCVVPGCKNVVKVKMWGYCSSHYWRWRRHGDPLLGGPPRRPRVLTKDTLLPCGSCGEEKAAQDFYRDRRSSATRQSHCIACQKVRANALHVARRPDKSSPCTDCGNVFPPECMDWDHVPERGPKLFGLAQFWGRSPEEIASELAKCDLVCSNCHRIRTTTRAAAKRQSLDTQPKEA